ncbi:MAG: EAL domain-containing protein [Gaiellaceae bacterium]
MGRGLGRAQSARGTPGFSVSVNISGRQLRHRELAKDVQNALDRSGLPPACLVLEISESVLMDHSEENLGLLGELKSMGIRLAIDDFGTGYSSLSYLHRFPIDILKVDRSFIERLAGAAGDSGVVETIGRLGQSLRMETVAEGVELEEQVTILRTLGYDLAQGYHFSRPVEAEKLAELLGPRGLAARVLRGLGRNAA